MYRKILTPLDGSKRAERILTHVEGLAILNDAEIVLLHVIGFPIIMEGYNAPSIEKSLAETRRLRKVAEDYLEQLAAGMRDRGLRASVLIETGPVVEAILFAARREEADLIAIASHGRTGMARIFYGSVTAGVMQQVDRPLLLIRTRSVDGES